MSHYVTLEQLKKTIDVDDAETYLDVDIQDALDAAEQAIEGYKNEVFYERVETRYYTADPCLLTLTIDDAVSVSELAFDTDGNGSYDFTLVDGTDYVLDPVNAPTDSRPVRRIHLLTQAGRLFPSYTNGVKVTGTFGWADTPAVVKEATKILAMRLLKRRETPYGIVTVGTEVGVLARLARIDPDVAFLLDSLPGSGTVLFV